MDKYPKKFTSRVFTINLSLPGLLTGMAVLFGGFVFVFILGLLLGSGYDLEERIPGLGAVLPEKAPTPTPIVIAKNEEGDAQAKAPDDGKAEKSAAESKDGAKKEDDGASGQKTAARSGLIEQGDLAYRDRLKSDAASSDRAKPAAQKDDKKKKAEADKKKAEAEKKKAEAEKKKEAQKKKEERFKYLFQAASYKGPEYADKFTETLKKAGFKARTLKTEDKNVTWYRVMVDFTGTATEADELAQAIQKQGVSKMVTLSKKQVR